MLPMNRLDQLLNIVKYEFRKIEDFRQSAKVEYKLSDILLDNFLLFLLQFDSFRQFKSSGSQEYGIIKDCRINISRSQQKSVLDKIPPIVFRRIYKRLFNIVQKSRILERYVYYKDSYLILVDGTGYYSSSKVSCSNCLTRKTEKKINYQ